MIKKLLALILVGLFALSPLAQATTTNSGVNLAIANNADGWQAGGGTTARLFTITGAAWTLGATTMVDGANTFTMPGSSTTLDGLGTAQTFTAAKTFTNSDLLLLGSSTGATTFTSANAGATNYTATVPAATSTLAEVGVAATWTAAQTFTNSDILLLGSSTGATTFTSANAGATNYTVTVPAATDTMAEIAATQTLTNKTITSSTDVLGGVTMTLGSDGTADVYYRSSGGVLTRLGNPGANEILGYDSTDAIPAYMVLGSGLTYTHSTHTLSASGAGFSPIPTTLVASASQAMTTNNGYFANDGATLVVFTLPTTASVGDEVFVGGYSAGGWKLAQNASGQIIFGNVSSTAGTSGYISSNNQYDNVYLKCIVANNIWEVVASVGNITVN